ncbi:hypothetical protein ACKQTC_08555 [Peptococcus simiae]|uniref:XRE family transcriptional regulator n=1 Tax=Peptococcus simiae TaxID=1643805 RepID=A0ABW9H0P1_9FIRM
MDENKLKGVLRQKNKTYEDCARALDMSTTAFFNKMNGVSRFYVEEANALANFLNLNYRERKDIFLK